MALYMNEARVDLSATIYRGRFVALLGPRLLDLTKASGPVVSLEPRQGLVALAIRGARQSRGRLTVRRLAHTLHVDVVHRAVESKTAHTVRVKRKKSTHFKRCPKCPRNPKNQHGGRTLNGCHTFHVFRLFKNCSLATS